MKSVQFDYTSLSRVRLGVPVLQALQEELAACGERRVFVLISNTLSQRSDLCAGLADMLGERLAGIFNQIRAHSPREDVLLALAQAREAGTDIIVAVGGGSVIDAGKALQFCLNAGISEEHELLRYARFSDGTAGERCGQIPLCVRAQPVYQISVPTTLSGAEFSNNAGITDSAKGAKEGYRAAGLCARCIIYDPALVLKTPDWLWLSTAVRALDHAIEGYCSVDAHEYVQGQYLHAMRLFSKSLPAMKCAPDNQEIRQRNQQATWLACAGLGSVRHGASHGIGYILGAMCGIPHGYTSCLMLPAVLAWNRQINAAQQSRIACALGAGDGDLAMWLRRWLQEMELPVSLQAMGIKAAMLPHIAQAAARHNVVRSNPRSITSPGDVMQILELAW